METRRDLSHIRQLAIYCSTALTREDVQSEGGFNSFISENLKRTDTICWVRLQNKVVRIEKTTLGKRRWIELKLEKSLPTLTLSPGAHVFPLTSFIDQSKDSTPELKAHSTQLAHRANENAGEQLSASRSCEPDSKQPDRSSSSIWAVLNKIQRFEFNNSDEHASLQTNGTVAYIKQAPDVITIYINGKAIDLQIPLSDLAHDIITYPAWGKLNLFGCLILHPLAFISKIENVSELPLISMQQGILYTNSQAQCIYNHPFTGKNNLGYSPAKLACHDLKSVRRFELFDLLNRKIDRQHSNNISKATESLLRLIVVEWDQSNHKEKLVHSIDKFFDAILEKFPTQSTLTLKDWQDILAPIVDIEKLLRLKVRRRYKMPNDTCMAWREKLNCALSLYLTAGVFVYFFVPVTPCLVAGLVGAFVVMAMFIIGHHYATAPKPKAASYSTFFKPNVAKKASKLVSAVETATDAIPVAKNAFDSLRRMQLKAR